MPRDKKYKYGAAGVRTDERTKMATQLLAAHLTLNTGDNISQNMAIWIAIKEAYPKIAEKAIKFYNEKKNREEKQKGLDK